MNIFQDEMKALYQESARLGEAEKKRLKDSGVSIKHNPDEPIVISIQELMANECS